MLPLEYILILSAVLFFIGLAGVLIRRHVIIMLICIEMMLNAANINFIAFWRYNPNPELHLGPLFTLFSIAVGGAEAAVGLGLVIAVYRFYNTANADKFDMLKDS